MKGRESGFDSRSDLKSRTSRSLSTLWRRVTNKCAIEDLNLMLSFNYRIYKHVFSIFQKFWSVRFRIPKKYNVSSVLIVAGDSWTNNWQYWNILDYSGTFWNILEHSGIFWNILGYSGIFWNILECSGIFWNIPKKPFNKLYCVHIVLIVVKSNFLRRVTQ